jgi:acyl carrier protein
MMGSIIDDERLAADPATRERDLLAVVAKLARELHPQHSRVGEVSLSSRIEKDLGIDSLGRTELVLRLERAFGARLSISLVAEADIVGDLLRALEQADQSGATIAAMPANVAESTLTITNAVLNQLRKNNCLAGARRQYEQRFLYSFFPFALNGFLRFELIRT